MSARQEAIAAYERGDREGAALAFSRAVKDDPSSSVACDLAIVYCELGRFSDAIDTLEPYLSKVPGDVVAWCTISNALLEQNESARALQAAQKANALEPGNWIALIALANAQTDLGEFDGAFVALTAAAAAAPARPEPLVNKSALYTRTRRPHDAVMAAKKAISIAPNDVAARVNLAIARLLCGDYPLGFAEYEWRRRDPARASLYDRGDIAHWAGALLPHGTLLVGIEQGMGDFICFSRLLREARQRVGRVVCEVPEPLLDLFRDFNGIDAVRPSIGAGSDEHFDAFVPIASLPHVLDYSPGGPHSSLPYLHADPSRVRSFAERFSKFGKRRTIGIVWSGNPEYRMDRQRSIDVSELTGLAGVDDVAWVSLQKGATEESVDSLPFRVHCLGESLADFADTAAAIEALDSIVTVDTAVAHLAGALGKPVRTIIGFAQHWLWQLDRADTPWYPTMRLFRQKTPHRWDDVIAEIAAQLRAAGRF